MALTHHRIESFAHGRVTFRYTHARTHETRRLTLPVDTFIARVLEHVLPRGFTTIRYYGLLSATGRTDLERARHLLELHAAPQAAADGATTSCEVTLPDGGQATGDAPDARSGGDGDTMCVADVRLLAIPAVRRCSVCGRGALRLVARSRRSRAPPS